VDKALDEEIGVTAGTLGDPNLLHPPARRGVYSAAAAGAGPMTSEHQPAEGPMSGSEEE
jgi:hypothetical protein